MNRKNQEHEEKTASPVNGEPTITPLRKPVQCPNCNKMSSRKTYPFCCKRCADVDLGRWFTGSYSIPETNQYDDGADNPGD